MWYRRLQGPVPRWWWGPHPDTLITMEYFTSQRLQPASQIGLWKCHRGLVGDHDSDTRVSFIPSSTMSQSPDHDLQNDNHSALKRRIAALEEQNADLRGERSNKRWALPLLIAEFIFMMPLVFCSRADPYLLAGRAIRRLVSLNYRVEDLVGEYDRRTTVCGEDDSVQVQHTEE